MKIITAPHPTLRTVAKEVQIFDKKLRRFLLDLGDTLAKKENPRGVGLASVQVDKTQRAFAVVLGSANQNSNHPKIELFVNPRITKHSRQQILGLANGEERFEGCLSIPMFYGPVPRAAWIEVEYLSLSLDKLRRDPQAMPQEKRQRFEDFDARVILHEYDHLEGILFTDHILRHDLPLYMDEDDRLVQVSNKKEVIELLG